MLPIQSFGPLDRRIFAFGFTSEESTSLTPGTQTQPTSRYSGQRDDVRLLTVVTRLTGNSVLSAQELSHEGQKQKDTYDYAAAPTWLLRTNNKIVIKAQPGTTITSVQLITHRETDCIAT